MKHVLVIRLSALGDVAILAPVMRSYAVANPGVRFTVAGPPMLQPLFEGMANVDYLGLKKRQPSKAIYKALKSVGASEVADLHVVNRVGRALFLLKADAWLHGRPLKVCRLHKGRLSRWLFIHRLDRKPRKLQWQRYDDVFRRIGFPPAPVTPPSAGCPLSGKPIGVAPFAQHEGKIWPLERTEALVRMLAERGRRVILFGSKDEAPVLEGWVRRYQGVTSMAGRLPFAEEMAIIRDLALMVSMDSANMHFASALGVPVVSVWGATHPDFGFYGYGQDRANALCANLPCQPCSAYGKKPCRYGDRRCMLAITPEMVLEKIEAMFKNNIVNTQ